MWIKELQIKHFGKFTNKVIEFAPGINLVYGENESGKSTVFSFIRGCLYGIRKQRGRAAKKDEYSHYQPWDNGNYYAGNLRFVCGDKVFRLERDFVSGMADDLLVCETDGELLSLENGDLDMLLGEVGEVAFSNTVSVGQLKNETDEGLVAELQNYIANYQESCDQSIDIDQVFLMLKNKKKELERQNLKEKEKQESKVRQLTDYMGYLDEEVRALEDKLDEETEKISRMEQQLQRKTKPVEKESVHIERPPKKRGKKTSKLIPVSLLLIEIAMLAVMYFFCYLMGDFHIMKELVLSMFLISVVLICGLRLVQYWMEDEPFEEETDIDTEDVLSGCEAEDTNGEEGFLQSKEEQIDVYREMTAALDKMRWRKEHFETELEEKKIQMENCQQEMQFSAQVYSGDKERIYKENKEALVMAHEYMLKAMQKLQSSTGVSLKKRTSEIFSEITGGYYTQVQIDDNLCVGVHTKDRYVPLEQLSRGTIWQVYFAYRMAAGELLTQEEPLPIILDDAFVMYDEVRLTQVLKWLSKQEKQVLLFTCQKREQEILERMGAAYREVCL